MKLFQRKHEDVTVQFISEDENGDEIELEGVFRIRERRVKHAAEFITDLEMARLCAAEASPRGTNPSEMNTTQIDQARAHFLAALRHVLGKQVSGDPIELTDEMLAGLLPSVVESLLDLQGQMYGFSTEEERVGKKFSALIEALFTLQALTSMSFGLNLSKPAPTDTESSPGESGESGPSESLTTSTDAASEMSGESESGSESLPAESPEKNPTSD